MHHLPSAISSVDLQLRAKLGPPRRPEEHPSRLNFALFLVQLFPVLLLLFHRHVDLLRGEVLGDLVLNLEDPHAQLLVERVLELLTEEVKGV